MILIIENNIGRELSLQFEAKKKLEQIDDLKNQFISLISPYLRTPMTSIKGCISEMEETPLSRPQKQDLRNLGMVTNGLENTIEKLLIISSIQRGHATVTLVPTDLNPLISEVVRVYQPIASSAKVTMEYQPLTMQPVKFSLDPLKMREVMISLIDNAVKYNQPGGFVKISVNSTIDKIQIQVTDSGQGVKKDHLSTLFSTFNIGGMDKVLHFDKQDMGLSLYLAKLIIEAHKGKIQVQSTEGQGAVFTVSLPIIPKSQIRSLPTFKEGI